MESLIASMVIDKPDQRITMDEAVRELDKMVSKLPAWRLRSRLRRRKDHGVIQFLKDIQHVYRTAGYILLRRPAIPVPPPPTEFDGKRIGRQGGLIATVLERLRRFSK